MCVCAIIGYTAGEVNLAFTPPYILLFGMILYLFNITYCSLRMLLAAVSVTSVYSGEQDHCFPTLACIAFCIIIWLYKHCW